MATAEMDYVNRGGNNTAGHYGGSFMASTSTATQLTCDFAPTKIILWQSYNSSDMDVVEYDVAGRTAYEWYKNTSARNPNATVTGFFTVAADGTVSFKPSSAAWEKTTWWVAIKE